MKIIDIAELFNSYFVEIIQILIEWDSEKYTNYSRNLKINICPQTIFINPVSENEIEKVVKKLNGKYTSGFDDVTEFFVKKCGQFIKKPLTDICNASFESGTFPDRLITAIIKPLHKKGNTEEVQNYRPISLLSVFQKS